MSMAAGASYHSPAFGAHGRLSGAVSPRLLGDDLSRRSPVNLHAPQGRVPAQLTVPSSSSRPESRPDFARGFGLDIPEEEEEEEEITGDMMREDKVEEEAPEAREVSEEEDAVGASVEKAMSGDVTVVDPPKSVEDKVGPISNDAEESGSPVKVNTHYKHPSRVSVALSVGSRKNVHEPAPAHSSHSSVAMTSRTGLVNNEVNALNEWTGSESVDLVSDSEVSHYVLCTTHHAHLDFEGHGRMVEPLR